MSEQDKPLVVEYDALRDVLTVDGMRYAGHFFRAFAKESIGTVLQIIEREDGVIAVRKVELHEQP